MPDIRGLIADPDFQSLPTHRKRAILERTGADPGFIGEYLGEATPKGYQKAAAGAETIGAAPWYAKPVLGGPSVLQGLEVLPSAGGLIGGMIGGAGGTVMGTPVSGVPAAVAGASLLGGLGEATKQGIRRLIGASVPVTSADAAKAIGKEAAIQGASELGGRGLAKAAETLGRGMVENSVRPTMTLQGEFPNVMQTIVKERLPVGKGYLGGPSGAAQAEQRLAEESLKVRKLLQAATLDGKTFETSKITKPVRDLIKEFEETEAQNPGRLEKLQELLDNFIASKPGPIGPVEVQKLKQAGQKIAKPIYKAVARGEYVGTEADVKAQFNAALASGAKKAMETIPGVAEGEATKRSLIGAQRALTAAERRRLSLMAESASGIRHVGEQLGGSLLRCSSTAELG